MIKIAKETDILSYFKQAYGHRPHHYYGFFNSQFGQIITDEHYMMLPADDRTATRAHGVFDVLYLKKKCIINIDQHIDRLCNSAASVSIAPPFQKQKLKEILQDVVETVVDYHLTHDKDGTFKQKIKQDSIGIRMTISSGYGDLGVASLGKNSILYIIVFEPYISYERERLGVNEYVTKVVKEPKQLVHSKTIDYVENAMMANEAKLKGGYQGIKILENGVLLEAASANIAFIFGREFATPRLETVIEGTTLKKCLIYLEQLKKEGIIDTISFRDISKEEAYTADEMIMLGGDKIIPVLNFDDKAIGEKCGPITFSLQEWYEQTNETGTCIKIDPLLL